MEDKIIAEMEKVVANAFYEDYNMGCDPYTLTVAEHLYNAGYRKQSVGEWTFERPNGSYYCSCCGKGIKIKYGERSPRWWAFCPNCGAKMKGGAE